MERRAAAGPPPPAFLTMNTCSGGEAGGGLLKPLSEALHPAVTDSCERLWPPCLAPLCGSFFGPPVFFGPQTLTWVVYTVYTDRQSPGTTPGEEVIWQGPGSTRSTLLGDESAHIHPEPTSGFSSLPLVSPSSCRALAIHVNHAAAAALLSCLISPPPLLPF